jgi:demethylsterigmatocystin 6-O-methyltransferase
MTIPREGEWLDVFPLKEHLGGDIQAETPVFVDVGGSFGQQCARLRAKYPDLPGRVICQDLPATLEHAPQIPGVDFLAQDFFEANTVKGAKFYYLRTVLHDWPEAKCADILGRLREACGEGSRILIDEMVLPNVGVHWQAATVDIHMGMCMAALERTRDQWEALAEKAGLRIESVKSYLPKLGTSVIVMAPK